MFVVILKILVTSKMVTWPPLVTWPIGDTLISLYSSCKVWRTRKKSATHLIRPIFNCWISLPMFMTHQLWVIFMKMGSNCISLSISNNITNHECLFVCFYFIAATKVYIYNQLHQCWNSGQLYRDIGGGPLMIAIIFAILWLMYQIWCIK